MRLSTSSETVAPGAAAVALSAEEQKAAQRKIWLRLIPLLFACYVIAYVDRINVGFAKLQLQGALNLSGPAFDKAFGFGAGIFFIGYFIFEVPSNLILHRVGARIWIARIMILWGLVSGAFMFLKSAKMFYVMRFLLGAAEAGFFPGVLLYFTYWYPTRERAKIIALFAIGGVVAGIVGSPISGFIMDQKLGLEGVAGLHNWQWLFLIEAIPSILLGFVILAMLPNGPSVTKWLTDRERSWVLDRVAVDAAENRSDERQSLRQVFTCGRVYLFCLIYFLMNVGSYGFEMWAPTIIKTLSGGSNRMVGLLNDIPYTTAAIMMFIVGANSDRTGERRFHIAISAFTAGVGFAIAASAGSPVLAMAGLVIAFAGLKCTIAPFWALTTAFLSGTGAAGGIALINSIGNLGGYLGPDIVGRIKAAYPGSNFAPLLVLGGSLAAMGIFTLTLRRPSSVKPK